MNTDTPAADAKAAKPKKLEIPAGTFETELTAGSVKTAMKSAGGVSPNGELWMVPVAQLRRIPGFNIRIETPSYKEHRNELKHSILANGFYKNKPLAGYVAKEGDEQVIYVTDGHTRLAAVEDAIEFDGAQIETLPVIVHPAGATTEDLTVALVQSNSGRNLTTFEKALVAKRLKSFGWEDAKIAESLSFTPRYVADLLVLAGASPKIRTAVINEKISPAEAVKAIKKHGDKAGAVIEAGVKKAEAKGKKKATPKDLNEGDGEGEGGSGGEESTKSKFTASVKTAKGKVHTTLTYDLKLGDILETDKIRPVAQFLDKSFWNFVDDTKGHVVIEEATKITVLLVQPEKDDTFDDAPTGKTAQEEASGATDDDVFDDADDNAPALIEGPAEEPAADAEDEETELGADADGVAADGVAAENLPDDGDAAVSDDEL